MRHPLRMTAPTGHGTADAQLRELHRAFPGLVSIRKQRYGTPYRERFLLEIDTGLIAAWTASPITWKGDNVPALIAKAHEWMRAAWE